MLFTYNVFFLIILFSRVFAEINHISLDNLKSMDFSGYLEGLHNCNECQHFDNLLNDISSDSSFDGNLFPTCNNRIGVILQTIGSSLPWIPTLYPPMIVFINAERKLPYLGPLNRNSVISAIHQFNTGVQSARLDDSNFEHDTQASTGLTTGHWLIIFDRLKALELYDGLSFTLRAKNLNIGVVDPVYSTQTAKRFNVSLHKPEQIEAILLRGSYMYRFGGNLRRNDFDRIIKFGLIDYENHGKLLIPRPRMFFDEIVDSAVDFTLKVQRRYGNLMVIFVCMLILSSSMILICLILLIVFWYVHSVEHNNQYISSSSTLLKTSTMEHDDDSDNRGKSKHE